MMDAKRIEEAKANVPKYLEEGHLKKEKNEIALKMYVKNCDLSFETAERLIALEDKNYKPHLWVIVTSYYSMFYIANAVLLHLGHKVGEKISHKVTEDCLIVYVRDRLRKELIEEYSEAREAAMELIASKTDALIESVGFEREKRSIFQYNMNEEAQQSKAITSIARAKEFIFEMKKLIK